MNTGTGVYAGDVIGAHGMRRVKREKDGSSPVKRRGYRAALRGVMVFFLVPVLVILLLGGGLAYLFQGRQVSLETVQTTIRDTLQDVVGPTYAVSIGESGLTLASSSLLALSGERVAITNRASGREVLFLEEVKVGLDLWSVLTGKPSFDRLVMSGGRADVSFAQSGAQASGGDAMRTLRDLGSALLSAEQAFRKGVIEHIEITEFTITAPKLGRIDATPILLNTGELGFGDDRLLLQANAAAGMDDFVLNAEWRHSEADGRQLSIGIGQLPARWWTGGFRDAANAATGNAPGFDIAFRVDARIPFNAQGDPLSPFLKVQANGGRLTLPRGDSYEIPFAKADFDLHPAEWRVEMRNAEARVDGAMFTGGGEALRSAGGEGAPVFVTQLNVDTFATLPGGQTRPLDIDLTGVIEPDRQLALFDTVRVSSGGHVISGRLETGRERGVAVSLRSDRTDLATVLGAWPAPVALRAREWIRDRMSGGFFSDFAIRVDIPAERMARILPDDPLRDSELVVDTAFSGLRVDHRPGLAPLEEASGTLSIVGNRLESRIETSSMQAPGAERVELTGGRLEIPALVDRRPVARITARAIGPVSPIAAIANQDPISALRMLKLEPGDLEGKADVAVGLSVPLIPGQGSTDWQASAKLAGVNAAKPLFDRVVTGATVDLEARPGLVTASGTARMDGLETVFDIAEPFGKKPAGDRRQDFRLKVTTAELAKQGISLAPVVSGPLTVRIVGEGGQDRRYEIDLTRADLSLPWIGWSKEAETGTRASVSFMLNQSEGVTTLRDLDFAMAGGRKASGNLSFNKAGLISANLRDVTLTGGDRFNVDVSREGRRYIIGASGAAFDGRSVLDLILRGDGLSSGGAGSDVSVSANFGRLTGFHSRVMENALIRYEVRGGRLDLLDVKGSVNGGLSRIHAETANGVTTFTFEAADAGASLALTDVYSKMQGGRLKSTLTRTGNGPFSGKVVVRDFTVIGEDRLASLTAAPAPDRLQRASGELRELDLSRVRFDDMRAEIVKAPKRLEVQNGMLRNAEIGLTFDGLVFDERNYMNVRGTFMPLFTISRLIGEIPLIGDILSNGRNSGLIGITYRLKGASKNPEIAVNPLSVVAPGIFRELFEFRN